jgi:hypothetical protein
MVVDAAYRRLIIALPIRYDKRFLKPNSEPANSLRASRTDL